MASAGPRTGRARHRALGWAGVAGLVLGALAVLRGVRGARIDPVEEHIRTALKPTSLFEFSESPIGESVRTQVPLRKYQTPELKFVMVVAFDPGAGEAQGQLQDLQALYEKYHPLGLEILGFVASDLAERERNRMAGVDYREMLKRWGITFPTFGKRRFNSQRGGESKRSFKLRFNCALWLRRSWMVSEYRLLKSVPELEQGEAWEIKEQRLRGDLGVLDLSTATQEDIERSMALPLMGNFYKKIFDRDGKYQVWPIGDPTTEWWNEPGYMGGTYQDYMSDKEGVLRQLLGLEEPRLADVRIALGLPQLAPQKGKRKRARKKNKKGAAREL